MIKVFSSQGKNNGPKIECTLVLMLVCSAARMNKEESERASTKPFILPGKVIGAEWHKSSSLDKNIKSKLQWS